MSKQKVRRVAMVGTAQSAVHAPYNDPSWEIWGVGERGAYVTRADRWFEMHRLDGEPGDWAQRWRGRIKKFSHDLELIMLYPEPDLGPNVTEYPYQRIADRFGTFFMQSSFSWMMAFAIDEMVPVGSIAKPGRFEIGIWGVEMEYGTEYREQRTGFRHFIALAKQLGITMNLMTTSGLAFEPVPYPLWQDDPLLNKLAMRREVTRQTLDDRDKARRHTHVLIVQTEALLRELDKARKGNGYDFEDRIKQLNRDHANLMATFGNLDKEINQQSGAFEEQSYWKDYLLP